jgi:hypothetical protein
MGMNEDSKTSAVRRVEVLKAFLTENESGIYAHMMLRSAVDLR